MAAVATVDELPRLQGDPLPWLLDPATPAVRAAALQRLLDRPSDDPEVVASRRAAMGCDPIAGILAAQDPGGWWVKPGPGYGPKYRGTVWSLLFLDQLGADPEDERIERACEYLLTWTSTATGGFGCSGSHLERQPPPSTVLHCLNGNLLRALIGFGYLDDERVQAAIAWAAAAITGDEGFRAYRSGTCGPGFACAANDRQPCAWGALKELRGLARIPAERREASVVAALEQGAAFLLSRDPAVADYPMGYGNERPNGSWFKLGFPSAYVSDVLQTLEVLLELGHGADPRLDHVVELVTSQQDAEGRWRNRYAYNRKTLVDIEVQGQPSKWVTLRAWAALRGVAAARVVPVD
jgi:hypothetical protein